MKLVCIGHNCAATHIAQECGIYAGCSPTDWTICSPTSTLKILSWLYSYDLIDCVKKFFDFVDLPDRKNYNVEWDIYAPHHSEHTGNSGFGYYHYSEHTREKVQRRFERLYQLLTDQSEQLILLYVGPCQKGSIKSLSDEPFRSLKKISALVSLFRPKSTYRICFIDVDYDGDKVAELAKDNIDYLQGFPVEEERFWVLPCVDILRRFYDLK